MMTMIVMVNMVTTITMVKIMKLVCQTGGDRPLCSRQGLLGPGALLQVCYTFTQIHSYRFIIFSLKIFSVIILHNAIAITIMTTIVN